MDLFNNTESIRQLERTPGSNSSALLPFDGIDIMRMSLTLQDSDPQIVERTPDPLRSVTAENIRELRERIRYRYCLDVKILKQRNAKPFVRGNLEENMREAVAVLADIQNIVQGWDRRDFFASDLEYRKFQDIRNSLLAGTKIDWGKSKPWELDTSNMVPPVRLSQRVEALPQQDTYALVSTQQNDLPLISNRRELGVRSPPPSELAPGSPPPTIHAPHVTPDGFEPQSCVENVRARGTTWWCFLPIAWRGRGSHTWAN